MKIKICLLITLIFSSLLAAGCYTPVAYSFAENDAESRTASIKLESRGAHSVRIIDFEGQAPELEEKTYMSSVVLPAGRPLDLRVYVCWDGDREGYRRRGIFKCPPLEVNGEYRLWFKVITEGFFVEMPISYSIVLEKKRETIALSRFFTRRSGSLLYDEVCVQVIPELKK